MPRALRHIQKLDRRRRAFNSLFEMQKYPSRYEELAVANAFNSLFEMPQAACGP